MITLTPYCSVADLQRFFSAQGVAANVDDTDDAALIAAMLNDCITRATTEITDFGQNWYDPTGLLQSPTINRWACVLATFYLCERRGNEPPVSVANDYTRIMGPGGYLERLQIGTYKLAGVAMRSTLIPSFSNMTIDRNYSRNFARVTKSNSSPETTSRPQDLSSDLTSSFY